MNNLRAKVHFTDYQSWCKLEGREVNRYQLSDTNVVSGKVPTELNGIWLRNGPGKFKIGRDQVLPLDGDGFIYRVEFEEGEVFASSRFVRTKGFQQEELDQRISMRGAFGTMHHKSKRSLVERIFGPGVGIPKLKNTANTTVFPFGENTLLALWEGGLPHLLDAETLETIECESRLNNSLMRGDMFSAHPKVDKYTNCLVNAGPNMEENMRKDPFRNYIKIWQIDEKFNLLSKLKLELIRPFAVMHELALTKDYIVIPQCPVEMNIMKLCLGADLAHSWKELDKPLLFYLVPKFQESSFGVAKRIVCEVPKCFGFHIVNAFERGNSVIVDMVVYEKLPNLGKIVSPEFAEVKDTETELQQSKETLGKFVRFELDTLQKKPNKQSFLYGSFNDFIGVEFPCINPRYEAEEYRYAYFVSLSKNTVSEKYQQLKQIIKIDTVSGSTLTWSPPDSRTFLNEPCFVEKKDYQSEDDGYLLFSAYHGAVSEASSFFILNASDLSTICHFRLDVAIPIGVHTSWQPKSPLFRAKL